VRCEAVTRSALTGRAWSAAITEAQHAGSAPQLAASHAEGRAEVAERAQAPDQPGAAAERRATRTEFTVDPAEGTAHAAQAELATVRRALAEAMQRAAGAE
jgi:hypothetical protein